MANRLNQFDLRGAVAHQMGFNAIEYEKILDDMTRAELIAIMPGILADYRADIEQKKADIVKAMNEAVDKLISLHKDGDWPDIEYLENLYEEYANRLKLPILCNTRLSDKVIWVILSSNLLIVFRKRKIHDGYF